MKKAKLLRKNLMKKIEITLLVAFLLPCFGCSNAEEEVIPSDYENGVYAPKDQPYILTLPSADWKIEGEELSNNIIFTYKSNQIQVEVITENLDEITKNLPNEQADVEQKLKNEGYFDCEVVDFCSTHDYENGVFTGEKHIAYLDYKTGSYVLERDIILPDVLFQLTAVADTNHYSAVQNTLNQFELTENIIGVNSDVSTDSALKEENVYTSYDGIYTLLLPYESWEFSVDEENRITTMTSENKTLTIYEIDSLDINNSLTYEVPRNLIALEKQIASMNSSDYRILSFHEQTVDAVSDMEMPGYYQIFSYLLAFENVTEGDRYYSYYEYRDDNRIYKIIGTTDSLYLVDSNKLMGISNSFTLK